MKILGVISTKTQLILTDILRGADIWDKSTYYVSAITVDAPDNADVDRIVEAVSEDPEVLFFGSPGIFAHFKQVTRISMEIDGVLKTCMMYDLLCVNGFTVTIDRTGQIISVK